VETRVAQQGLVTVLSIVGPLIEEELAPLNEDIARWEQQRPVRLVLNMSEVTFIDSVALEWLQHLSEELSRGGGEVRIAALNEVGKDIFAATRMEHFVSVSENTETAVRSLL